MVRHRFELLLIVLQVLCRPCLLFITELPDATTNGDEAFGEAVGLAETNVLGMEGEGGWVGFDKFVELGHPCWVSGVEDRLLVWACEADESFLFFACDHGITPFLVAN